jgi:predicted ATPase/DNA-binding SARP family transcriptional activator
MEFRILGPLEVWDEGRELSLGGPKPRALLALLLLHANTVVSADRLIDELWGEDSPEHAADALRVNVSRLRKALPRDVLTTRSPGYVVQVEPDALDLHRFERLVDEGRSLLARGLAAAASKRLHDALSLWRGPALADFAYESFAQAAIARLEEIRLAAVELRIEADLALGQSHELVGELEVLVADNPLRERLRISLMTALYRAGRQAEALDAYQDARRALVDELGIDPSPALQELERAILRHDPALEVPQVDARPKTNLPRPASSFVGRERELAELLSHIEGGARLLTLTGPGGSGKTRLGLEVASWLVPSYEAGVSWVDLAELRDAALVGNTISQTLGAKSDLVEQIGDRELLLLLDNFEQVIYAAAELSALLRACPNLTLLVTSREPLRVDGEVEYRVPPLTVPEAVDLFCERSQLEPADEIAELCERLDNLPLGIELAAARTKALSPRQILERLSHRHDLLRGGRDADQRHQSLRATIEWSYDLLTADEQRLFRRLSVFAGGCTLEAAEEVCSADLDILQSLVEKSLLRFSNERYSMLETIREYALARLDGERESIRRRHINHFLRLAEQAQREGAPREVEWLEWADAEHANLREALRYAREAADTVRELRLATALAGYWAVAGFVAEGHQRLADALRRPGVQPPAVRAQALIGFMRLAVMQGAHEQALATGEECLRLQRELGDKAGEAWALLNLGNAYELVDDRETARTSLEASAELFRELEEWGGVVTYLNSRGNLALVEHDYEHARALFEEGLELRRRLGWPEGRGLLSNIGFALLMLGRDAEAEEAFQRGLELSLAVSAKHPATFALEGVAASIAVAGGDDSRAVRLFGAAAALREDIGAPLAGAEAPVYERTLATLRERLGEAGFSAALADGRAMSLDEAATEALSLDRSANR